MRPTHDHARILSTSGLVAALVVGVASAQSGDATDDPTSPRPRSDRDSERVQDLERGERASPEALRLLQNLEGIWEVDVSINGSVWRSRMGDSRPGGSGEDADAERGRQRNQERDRESEGRGTPTTMRGIAEASTVLGGNVLKIASILTPGESAGAEWALPSADGNETSRSLSFFSFDPSANEYSAVFMSDMDGTMHHSTGKYDSGSRRIVFGKSGSEKTTEAVDASVPRSDQRRSERDGRRRRGQREAHAVLQMKDENTFEVTMYLGDEIPGAANRGSDAKERDAVSDVRDDERSADASDDERREPDAEQRSSRELPNNVLYRATYKKAQLQRQSNYDRAMREDERRMRNEQRKRRGSRENDAERRDGDRERDSRREDRDGK